MQSSTVLPVELAPWELKYLGRVYDEGRNLTRFEYQMRVGDSSALDKWTLETKGGPELVFADFADQHESRNAIQFRARQLRNTVWTYTVTLAGHVSEALVRYHLQGAGLSAEDSILGPACV